MPDHLLALNQTASKYWLY